MAPVTATEDYYHILQLPQTATLQDIIKSYRRLALQLHPDRNKNRYATANFQLLGRAYQTLKDTDERRAYDHIYHKIKKPGFHPPPPNSRQDPNPPHPTPPNPSTEATQDAEELANLYKSKADRERTWSKKKRVLEGTIFELQRQVRTLERDIKAIEEIMAAVAASEAWNNSWGAWVLSPFTKRPIVSEEEKERRNRDAQNRKSERDVKERRLDSVTMNLDNQRHLHRDAEADFCAANSRDDIKIQNTLARIRNREERERWRKEWAEAAERAERHRKHCEEERERQKERERRREKERAEYLKKQEAAAEKQREELSRRREQQRVEQLQREKEIAKQREALRQKQKTCNHDGWWPKVEGRVSCPRCSESWTYLLRCPGCQMKACPKCQYDLRPRRRHH